MCLKNNIVEIELTIDPDYYKVKKGTIMKQQIDRCIAPIVIALNDAGIIMSVSCCGHGKKPGYIVLADGRILRIHRKEYNAYSNLQ